VRCVFSVVGESRDSWKLFRRLFLVDNISGRQAVSSQGNMLRCCYSIVIRVNVIFQLRLQLTDSLFFSYLTDISVTVKVNLNHTVLQVIF